MNEKKKTIIRRPNEISIREASRLSGIPAATITTWHQRKLIAARREGQYVFINKAEFVKIWRRYNRFKKEHNGHTQGFRIGVEEKG